MPKAETAVVRMTEKGLKAAAVESRQLGSEQDSRRLRLWSNLSLTKDVLVGLALLVGIGVALSVGFSALDLIPRP